jgi:hypothetical protein
MGIHREEKNAEEFVGGLLALLHPAEDADELKELRPNRILVAKGFEVIGGEYPSYSKSETRNFGGQFHTFFTDDMRKPFAKEYFDYVFNLYTSFGFFDKAEHLWAVLNLSAALGKDGLLVMDYPETESTIKQMIPVKVQENDGIVFGIHQWADEDFVYRNIKVFNHQLGNPLEYTERICRLNLQDFIQLFSNNGLEIEQLYGDHSFNKYQAGDSPRLIIVARKAA